MARSRTTWRKGQSGSPATQWKPGQSAYPFRTRGTWPKGSGIPAKGRGWGGPASGNPAGPPAPGHQFTFGNSCHTLRGTPEAMARTEQRNRRRDMAEAKVFDVVCDSTNNFEVLAAAKNIQDRVDGKPMARQEITGRDGAPLLDYSKLPPEVLAIFVGALDKAEERLGYSLLASLDRIVEPTGLLQFANSEAEKRG